MKNNSRKIKWAQVIIIIAILAAILLPQLIGTTSVTGASGNDTVQISDIYHLDGVSQSVVTGSVYEEMAPMLYPNSSMNYYKEWSDLPLSVSQGKADAFIFDESSLVEMLAEHDELMILPGKICDIEYGFAFSNSDTALTALDEFNEYLSLTKSDGTMDELWDYWHVDSIEGLMPGPCTSDGSKGVLEVATSLDWPPFNFMGVDGPSGMVIDLVYRFCEWAGYEPVITNVDTESANSGLSVNRFDLWAYGNYPTPERSESLNFSDGFIPDTVYAVIRKSSYPFPITDKTLEVLEEPGVTVGVTAQSELEYILRTNYPNADIRTFINLSDVYEACAQGKVDYAIAYQDNIPYLHEAFDNLACISQVFATCDYGMGFTKSEFGAELCKQFNEYLASIKEDGTYDEYVEKWLTGNADNEYLVERTYSGENGQVNITTTGHWVGFNLYSNEFHGILPEIVNGFCEKYGYIPSYSIMPKSSGISGLVQGKFDIMMDSVAVNEENLEKVYISDVYHSSSSVVITTNCSVTSTAKASKASVFLDNLKTSFDKNFVRENRWKMILSGLKLTALMSIASAILGTMLGMLICALRRSTNPFLTGFARIYIKVMQGIPIVVLLMILYYLVFGQVDIDAFWVAVAGFSLDFAAYTSEIFRSGIESVPSGQLRAAIALGFGPGRAFRKVVLPQAMRSILPVYRGQFISMVKLTSVAGYISVEDLTKVSDMIRARTYDAFFPLITTAVIYFIIAALLVALLKLIEVKTDPLIRNRKPKGINLQEEV